MSVNGEPMELQEIQNMLRIFPDMMRTLRCGFVPDVGMAVSHTEFRTLMEMLRQPGMPMKHYARMTGIESGSFTYIAHKLERKGLVQPACGHDRRCTMLCLTPEGERVAAALRVQFDAHAASRVAALTAEERAELDAAIRILEHTLKQLERQNGPKKA